MDILNVSQSMYSHSMPKIAATTAVTAVNNIKQQNCMSPLLESPENQRKARDSESQSNSAAKKERSF